MLKEYIIALKVKGEDELSYFVGEGDTPTGITNSCWSNNSFHAGRVQLAELVFSKDMGAARVMLPKNMASWLGKILEQIPHWSREIDEIKIVTFDERRTL